MLIYAFLLFNIALLFFFWQDRWQLGNIFPTNYLKHVYGSSIGFISTIIGIGGGSLSTPLLKIYNFEIHRAIGTAAGIGAVIAMPGTIGFIISGIYNDVNLPLSLGYVNFLGLLMISPILSFIKVVKDTFQPSPSLPSLCESGIRTSLKKNN